jgi:hypothetical protein
MRFLLLIVTAAAVHTTAVNAQNDDRYASAPACEEAITVFQDVSAAGRKDRAAKNMTKKHGKMAVDGWRLISMQVYTENGDLEGFYLSYVRTVDCSRQYRD